MSLPSIITDNQMQIGAVAVTSFMGVMIYPNPMINGAIVAVAVDLFSNGSAVMDTQRVMKQAAIGAATATVVGMVM